MRLESVVLRTLWIAVLGLGTQAHAADQGNALCAGQPGGAAPVYIAFDRSYSLYVMEFRQQPDGSVKPERRNVGAPEIAMLCTSGLDVRARADDSVSGDFFPLAVEYHHAAFDHYFITTMAGEIRDLDSGVHAGWRRTGSQFRVYVNDPSWPSGQSDLAAACRYYGLPAYGLDTHFFSAFADECTAVAAKWPDRWLLEASEAFRVHLPDSASGACPAGTVPLYRLFNDRADVNHRYTASLAVRQQMIERAWIPEGHGPLGVAMCVRDA